MLSTIVRYICYACLGVGLVFMLPFVFLIVLDFFLWVYRTCANRKPAPQRPGYNATPKLSTAEAAASTAAAVAGVSDNTNHVRSRTRKA